MKQECLLVHSVDEEASDYVQLSSWLTVQEYLDLPEDEIFINSR